MSYYIVCAADGHNYTRKVAVSIKEAYQIMEELCFAWPFVEILHHSELGLKSIEQNWQRPLASTMELQM